MSDENKPIRFPQDGWALTRAVVIHESIVVLDEMIADNVRRFDLGIADREAFKALLKDRSRRRALKNEMESLLDLPLRRATRTDIQLRLAYINHSAQ